MLQPVTSETATTTSFADDHDKDAKPSYIDINLDPESMEPRLVGRANNGEETSSPGLPKLSMEDLYATVEASSAQDTNDMYTMRARLVSLLSLVASLIVATLGLAIGLSEEALALIGFGGEALLDALSSGLVLWRFKTPKQRQYADSAEAEHAKQIRDAKRERNSSIGIGWTFVIYAVILLISAVFKFLTFEPESEDHVEEEHAAAIWGSVLSWPSAIVFGILAVVKYHLAKALQSQVLFKDALCSLLGAVLALICAIAAVIENLAQDAPRVAVTIDSLAGGIIAIILFVEGYRTLRHNLDEAWESDHRPMS